MRNIKIQQISLSNFKGIRNETIKFDNNTDIFGGNGTGKTSIFDAFTWLLFGKDSTDRKDFEVKTLDINNVAIPKIEHEVAAVIDVDGEVITIKRVLKENWVKKRGSEVSEFTGNVTEYYWNEVPMQQKEFQSKVSLVLDEAIFKIITNPLAFNSMKWQEQRNVLVQIAGHISDAELAFGNAEYEKLLLNITADKSLEDYKKQITASIKKAKEDLKEIPTRIDEIFKSKPESYDYKNLQNLLGAKQSLISELDTQIQDSSKAFQALLDAENHKKFEANNLKSEINLIEHTAIAEAKRMATPDNSQIESLQQTLKSKTDAFTAATAELENINSKHARETADLEAILVRIDGKRKEWNDTNNLEFSMTEDCACPTCKRALDPADIEAKKVEMLTAFNTRKAQALEDINTKGQNLAAEKTHYEISIKAAIERIENGKIYSKNLSENIAELKQQIEAINAPVAYDRDAEKSYYDGILAKNTEYSNKKASLELVEKSINIDMPRVNTDALTKERSELMLEADGIKQKLQTEAQINTINDRIKSLENEESELARQISNVEKTQFVIENFNKLKIDTIEKRINKKFKYVNFKMFKLQINSGEAECCDALIDGVPFSDANTASKINAGLDIINTLCEFYQVTAPIFIDNRESIVEVIELDSQLINLIVSKDDIKLRVA